MTKALIELEKMASDAALRSPGWDGYDAPPLATPAIDTARKIISYGPAVVPTGRGGIQLEWHAGDLDLEIEIADDGRLLSVFAERASDNYDLTSDGE